MSDTWEHCFCPCTITFSKIYRMLGLSSNLTQTVFVYLCICICVLYVRHLGTLFLRSSYHLLFKNVSHHGSFQSVSKCLILLPTNHKRVWQTVFVYLCICVFVCVYLDVRHLGKLFLRSSYHLLFKNISHHGSFQGVSKCLILLPTNHKRGIKKRARTKGRSDI